MNSSRIKLIVIALVLLILAAFGAYFTKQQNNQKIKPATGAILPPKEAINVAAQYLQARENAVGVDQASPSSWLDMVKPITTASWFNNLQPAKEVQTSGASQDYRIAHDKDYIVSSKVSNCTWDDKNMPAQTDGGNMHCELEDQTLHRADRTAVPASELLFEWSHVGRQPAAGLKLVKQNGKWLVDGEITSNVED